MCFFFPQCNCIFGMIWNTRCLVHKTGHFFQRNSGEIVSKHASISRKEADISTSLRQPRGGCTRAAGNHSREGKGNVDDEESANLRRRFFSPFSGAALRVSRYKENTVKLVRGAPSIARFSSVSDRRISGMSALLRGEEGEHC